VLHQASAFILDRLRRKLAIPEDKFVVALRDWGNTVSSTIPMALEPLVSDGRPRARPAGRLRRRLFLGRRPGPDLENPDADPLCRPGRDLRDRHVRGHPDTVLAEHNWDSLAIVSTIALVDEICGELLDGAALAHA
jgi:hypothetical protein